MNKLLRKCYLTMTVQDGQLTIAALEHVKPILSPHTLELLAVERMEIGQVSVSRAEIIDEDKVIAILSSFARNYKFSSAAVVTLSPDVLIKFFIVPKMRRSEYKKFMVYGIHDALPVKLDDYTYDCKITGTQAFMAAIPKRVAESYVRLFTKLGINLTVVDIYENRVCEYTGELDKESHLTAFKSGCDYIFMYVSIGSARDICRIHNLNKDFTGMGRLSAFLLRRSVKKVYFVDLNIDELTFFFAENGVEVVHLTDLPSLPGFYKKLFTNNR